MADTKLTALAAGTPDVNDLIYFVDDPLGVPTSKKSLVGSLPVAIGTTPIAGGVAGRILAHSAVGDVVTELPTTGSGAVVQAVAPSFSGIVSGTGDFSTVASYVAGPGLFFIWGGRSALSSPATNKLRISDAAAANGGVIDASTANLFKFRDPGDTANVDIQARSVIVPPVAVASLPASPVAGQTAVVNNSNAASYTAGIGAVVAGGGALTVPVFYDGTNWRIG